MFFDKPLRPSHPLPLLCAVLFVLLHALAGAAPQPAPSSPLPWLAGGDAQAREALRLLGAAEAHGLDPAHYDADALARRLPALRGAADAAAFERDLSAAMLRYLNDLRLGRTASVYRAPADTAARFDAAAYLAGALRERRLAQAVEEAAPRIPLYRRVQASLAQYRELARRQPQWPPLPPLAGAALRPGSPYAGAALLGDRLRLLGDLDAADAPAADDGRYTPQLAAALKRFQARHGLADDGVLGPQTLAALSVPLPQRAAQLALTLERLRWLPPLQPGPTVAVNLPAYRLWAFDSRDQDAEPALEMRIIVGTAARTPTPLFIGQMRYLELNPYWNVPRSIVLEEIIPKLARDPSYLRQNAMELVSAGGRVLPPDGALAALRAGSARLRQRPGPGNVLGALKFAMPNPMNIYLHSTSAKELFNRSRRDLSHGCIRVERPLELAQFVLADQDKWNMAALEAAIGTGATRTLTLPAPVPVLLFYATAVTGRDGRALFAQDIYGQDARLIRALQAP